ncbi:MAG: hypothetical protein ACTSR2_13980 [Candidatus Hodarchaeales archaeon]
MKRSWISAVFVLTFVINIVISGSVANGLNRSQDTMLNLNENQLVVYTYDSLLADPFYDIEGNFSTYANIPRDTVQVIRFSDANEIITRIIAEKDQPQADVGGGIDSALIHMVQNIDEVL